MIKWFKEQTPSLKVMIVMVVVSILGIIMKWESVSKEASEAFNSRLELIMGDEK